MRAVNEARTRDLRLGKPPLYQLSYYRKPINYNTMKNSTNVEIFI